MFVVGVAGDSVAHARPGVPSGTLFPGPLCPSAIKAAERARSGVLKSEQALVARRNVSEFCGPFIVASFGYQGPLVMCIL